MQILNNRSVDAIETLLVSTIRKNPRNARVHDQKQIAKLKASVSRFEFVVPVLVDDRNVLLCGHARVEAAEQLGLTTIPAIRVQHLSEAEKRAFVIADNRLAELASWNQEILREELKFLDDFEINFDFATIGFETAQVDLILDAGADPKADAFPEKSPAGQAVSSAGDLWHLGSHRLLCGNALEASSYDALLAGERAQMVFTDPPYNVPIDGHVVGSGAVKHREFTMASGEMTQAQFVRFLAAATKQAAAFSVDGSIHFLCMDWRHTEEIIAAGKAAYTELKNICVWNKTNAGMGSLYRSKHEFVFVFKNGRSAHINNVELGAHGRYRTNVWDYQGINCYGRDRDALLALHPTVKPVALVADAIKDCSKRGGLILDPFAGSGTTIIAAEKTRRRAAAIEIDPLYIDAAVRRWQTYTGTQAVCAKSGETFDAREAAVAATGTGGQK